MIMHVLICFKLTTHLILFALRRAPARVGSSMLARMPIMAITTNSSMRVNALRRGIAGCIVGLIYPQL